MNHAFIGGIPASGKSFLAAKIAKEHGMRHVEVDAWREELRSDSELKKWVDFFSNQDEQHYLRTISCEQQLKDLRSQSEALWPALLEKILRVQKQGKPTIFEGVNILPHLAARDLEFQGIFLLGESAEILFERNKKDPRWGETEHLQEKEAHAWYYCESPMYEQEAKKHNYKSFTDLVHAEKALIAIIKKVGR